MSSAQAILIGAVLIALSIIIVSTIRPAEAQRYGGPFQLMHHSNTSGNAGVFRLDTASGEVSFCYVANADGSTIVCSKPVR
jgi:hypothetical protein